jgi:hypothetical protein
MKRLATRLLQAIGLLAIVWVIAWIWLGAKAALGIVLICVIAGLVGTLVTLD